MEKMIPVLREGFDPPQGLSYKKFPKYVSLFVRVKDRVVRVEASRKFPWLCVKTLDFSGKK